MQHCRFIIDGMSVRALRGTTVLLAARAVDIAVPSLCNSEGCTGISSCMVCLVRDVRSGRFIPACSTPVADGLEIDASSESVRKARRESIELLLGEHTGDCIAPCTLACPAELDIPGICARVCEGDSRGAVSLLFSRLPLPETASWLCGGYCEKACRHTAFSGCPVPVRALKKLLLQDAPVSGSNTASSSASDAGTTEVAGVRSPRHAVVEGAGLSGLCAVSALADRGIHVLLVCNCSDSASEAFFECGGKVPEAVLRSETARILSLPEVTWIPAGTPIPGTFTGNSEIVFLSPDIALPGFHPSEFLKPGANRVVNLVPDPSAAPVQRMAAALAAVVSAVNREPHGAGKHSPSSLSRLGKAERSRFFATRVRSQGVSVPMHCPDEPNLDIAADLVRIAELCLCCGCAGAEYCSLKEIAALYGAHQPGDDFQRPVVSLDRFDACGLVHEPSKCLLCGRCIRAASLYSSGPSLSFTGRGLSTLLAIGPGIQSSRDEQIDLEAIRAIAASCPTAALRCGEDA